LKRFIASHHYRSICLLILISFAVNAQQSEVGSNFTVQQTPEMQDLLKETDKHLSVNKNKFALHTLKRYGKLMDSEITTKLAATHQSSISDFEKKQRSRLEKIKKQEIKISELKNQSGDISQENSDLSRRTLFIIVLIIGLGAALLFYKMKTLKALQEELKFLYRQRDFVDNRTEMINDGVAAVKQISDVFSDVIQSAISLPSLIALTSGRKQEKRARTAISLLHKLQISGSAINSAVDISAKMEADPELQKSNLNNLIEEVLLLVTNSKKWEPENTDLVIKKDLEEILPEIEIDRARLRYSLYQLISNAYDAVHEKAKLDKKGYIPTISITTRKLPQFIQLRIKDNGVGIDDKDLSIIFDPFYSGKNDVSAIGLGLTECNTIIKKFHKGELLVESELGTGSDFIIRFPIKHIM
jgi:signal transduction histidine kinase